VIVGDVAKHRVVGVVISGQLPLFLDNVLLIIKRKVAKNSV